MKNTLRIFVLLLALLMVLPLAVACDDKGDKEETTTDGDTTTAATTNGETTSQPSEESSQGSESETTGDSLGNTSLPGDVRWDGQEYLIVGTSNPSSAVAFSNFEIARDDYDPTDLVSAAVYERNELLEEKYGFIVMQNLITSTSATVDAYASPLLAAQDSSLGQLLIYKPNAVQAHASQGYFLNLKGVNYIDLKHESWNQKTTQQLTFGGKLFYNTSNFLLQDKIRSYFLIYNRELARTHNHGYLEDHVENNTWTLETFKNYKKEFSYEMDGVDGTTTGDMWGLVAESSWSYSAFAFGAGLSLSTIGEDGYPVLTGATEHMVNIMDSLAEIVAGSDGKAWFYDNHPKIKTTEACYSASTTHLASHALFHCTFPSVFETAYSVGVPFEYGFLPFPKFDSSQEEYFTTPNYPGGSIFAIPYTVEDEDMAGFFLQAITEESTDTSYYAFIEDKCKLEDSFDQRCADMLDLVFQNISYDLAAMNDYGGLNKLLCSTLPLVPTMSYATVYSSYAGMAQKKIEDIKNAYEALE